MGSGRQIFAGVSEVASDTNLHHHHASHAGAQI